MQLSDTVKCSGTLILLTFIDFLACFSMPVLLYYSVLRASRVVRVKTHPPTELHLPQGGVTRPRWFQGNLDVPAGAGNIGTKPDAPGVSGFIRFRNATTVLSQ